MLIKKNNKNLFFYNVNTCKKKKPTDKNLKCFDIIIKFTINVVFYLYFIKYTRRYKHTYYGI